jgi:type IV pilus assembly protein PilQ
MRWKGTFQYLAGLAVLWALALPALSQNRLPQEYFSADEIITLAPDMTYEEAFQVLSGISYKKEGKIILDPLKRQGQIGVAITNLPWKKAFEVILKAHNMFYVEHEKFYEVVGEVQQEEAGKEKISTKSREIRIEAIFFEADRGKLAEAGIDWSFLREGAIWSGGFGVKGANDVSSEIVEGNITYGKQVNGIDYTVTGMLRAFESQNLGRIIAQPQVVVLSGKEGRIQVGQDFSIKTRDFAGNIIDNFFSTGTIMTVTPIVHVENDMTFIHLSLHAERSSAIPDPVSTTINKSQANTDVLLTDGECTLVGGLYTRENKTVRRGVPYLKDLPWWALGLKYVFGYNQRSTTDKELVVVLRASLLPELKSRIGQPAKSLNEGFDQGYDKTNQDFEKTWDTLENKDKK